MKTIVALTMGFISGFMIYMMAAMIFISAERGAGPSAVFVATAFFGGWALSTWLLRRGQSPYQKFFPAAFFLGLLSGC